MKIITIVSFIIIASCTVEEMGGDVSGVACKHCGLPTPTNTPTATPTEKPADRTCEDICTAYKQTGETKWEAFGGSVDVTCDGGWFTEVESALFKRSCSGPGFMTDSDGLQFAFLCRKGDWG